jgi:aflatoxin B1 aldehyde reductase
MQNINLILGTMTFGESVFAPDVAEFIDAYFGAGYSELDTAYVYNEGQSEMLLGEVLPKLAKPFKIATKVNPRISGKLDGEAAFMQLNESLQRLGLESVDIFYLHFPDPQTPVDSVLEACNELNKQGKFKEFGLSNFPAWMVADIQHKCARHGWITPTVFQGVYNPLTRKAEVELNDCLNYFGMRFYAYNPLAGGLLTGRYRNYEDAPTDGRFTHRKNYQNRYWKESYFNSVVTIENTASKYGISSLEATYRWLAFHSMLDGNRGDAIIVGASKVQYLRQNLATIQKGSLPKDVVEAFDVAWDKTKADSPEYFKFFEG